MVMMNKILNKMGMLSIGALVALGIVFSTQKGINVEATGATFSFATDTTASKTGTGPYTAATWVAGPITMTLVKDDSATNVGGSSPYYFSNPLRIYWKQLVTFSSDSTVLSIDSIVITANDSTYASNTAAGTWTNATAVAATSTVTCTATPSTKTISYDAQTSSNLQARWNSLVVNYTLVSGSSSESSSSDPIPVSSITLNKTATAIANGSSETLSVSSVLPANATDKTYTWSSTDNTVASVSSGGLVSTYKVGTVTIMATANDGSAVHGDCVVTVVTVLISSFTAVSGSINTNIAYVSYKGGGTSAPAINDTQIRLYQNASGAVGGYITISAAAGYKISAFTTTSAMATSLDYSVGNATTWSGTKTSVAVGVSYSQSGLNTSEVSIGCFGTVDTARYYVSSIGITYAVSTDPTISINSVPLNINVSATGTLTATTANSGGAPVTWSSDNVCLTVNSTTGAYTANSIGTAHVTASMTVNSVLYTSVGSVNVSGPATIAECLSISTSIGSGNTTSYKVTVGGNITATATSTVTISDGVNTLLVYGTYSPNDAATKGWIINGTISFSGYVQNYKGTPEITTPSMVTYTDSAISYSANSNSALASECSALNVSTSTWSTLAANYDALDTYAKTRLSGATAADANSSDIANFLSRYIYVVKKYGYTNFMNVTISPAANIDIISESKNDNSLILVIVIAALGLTAVTAYTMGKKKEEQA